MIEKNGSPRERRDAAVELVAMLLTDLFSEHKATCDRRDDCPTTERMEDSLRALYTLRKVR